MLDRLIDDFTRDSANQDLGLIDGYEELHDIIQESIDENDGEFYY